MTYKLEIQAIIMLFNLSRPKKRMNVKISFSTRLKFVITGLVVVTTVTSLQNPASALLIQVGGGSFDSSSNYTVYQGYTSTVSPLSGTTSLSGQFPDFDIDLANCVLTNGFCSTQMKSFDLKLPSVTYRDPNGSGQITRSLDLNWTSQSTAYVNFDGTNLTVRFEETRPSYSRNQETLHFEFLGTARTARNVPNSINLDSLNFEGTVRSPNITFAAYVFDRTNSDPSLITANLYQTTGSGSFAVPEPLTILGVGTALSFGVAFKRKLARSKGLKK